MNDNRQRHIEWKDIFPSSRHESFPVCMSGKPERSIRSFHRVEIAKVGLSKRFYRFMTQGQVGSSIIGMAKGMFGLSFASYIPLLLRFAFLGSHSLTALCRQVTIGIRPSGVW